jgi:hypothetical protein
LTLKDSSHPPSAGIASLSLDNPLSSASTTPLVPSQTAPLSPPTQVEDDASSFSSDDDFEDAAEASEVAVDVARDGAEKETVAPSYESLPHGRAAGAEKSGRRLQPLEEREKSSLSKAARLVREKLEEDVPPRSRLSKPLSSLTASDVALTEQDVKDDIALVWKAL